MMGWERSVRDVLWLKPCHAYVFDASYEHGDGAYALRGGFLRSRSKFHEHEELTNPGKSRYIGRSESVSCRPHCTTSFMPARASSEIGVTS